MSCRSFKLLALSGLLLPISAFGWGSKGHRIVVEVALQVNPKLVPRLKGVISHLPESSQLKELIKLAQATPLKELIKRKLASPLNNKGALIALIEKSQSKIYWEDLPRAATWPDDIRDFPQYTHKELRYNKHHFVNLVYGAGGKQDHLIKGDNAVARIEFYQKTIKHPGSSLGDKAWAAAWLLHLVGDLHQPLHTTARNLKGGSKAENLDTGGNDVLYGPGEFDKLHGFWDGIPSGVPKNVDQYAADLRMQFELDTDLNKRGRELRPQVWTYEGLTNIQNIGYPSDEPWTLGAVGKTGPVQNIRVRIPAYDEEARKVVDRQLYLAGVRLARILDKCLPKN